jgi:hypothetical protein
MICFYCDKEIEDRPMMVGIDRPYVNLYFHKPDCWEIVDRDLNTYLALNLEKIYNYLRNDGKIRKK